MNTPNQNQNLNNCQKHNQPLILFDQQQNQLICFTCLREKTGIVTIEQIQSQLQKTKILIDQEFKDEQQQLQYLLDSINLYKQNIVDSIDNIIQIIIDQIQNIKIIKEKFQKQLEQNNQFYPINDLKNQLKNQEDNHKKVKHQIKQLLSEFQQKYIDSNHLNKILTQQLAENQQELDSDKIVKKFQIQAVKQEMIQNYGKFQYELIKEYGIKENSYCHAFAFNQDYTILIVGCSLNIKIYEFSNGKIGKVLQVLNKDWVYCLHYMLKSDCFISGSRDHLIIIWKHENNNQWLPQQILKDHEDFVNCLLMNNNEDIFISGSLDRTIKFWKKDNNYWSCQQTIQTDNSVYAMSLNEQENILITCGLLAYVLVMEIQDDKQWSIKQKINVDQCGYRLCFTSGDQFVFQPKTKDYLELFNYDSNSNQFKKQSEVRIQSCKNCTTLFPCQYVKSLNILFVKHGQFLNIFQGNDEKNYELIQTIQFEHQYSQYGTVSNDGQYLITWDEGSEEIQVRRLKFMNG